MSRFILLLFVALGGCASYTASYHERLVRSLPQQRGVTFADTAKYPGQVLCGSYTALEATGMAMLTHAYVITPDEVLSRPSDVERAVFCSPQADRELFARLGIGTGAAAKVAAKVAAKDDTDSAAWTALAKVRDDMRAIDPAITRYHSLNQSAPRSLAELAEGDYGVAADALIDPWGRSYVYSAGLGGRTLPSYELATLGADGQAGGIGAAADISKQQLPMLSHVLRLRGL